VTSPLISLVTTLYNRQQFLAQTVESILAQTYPHFELILWDDGSSDGSAFSFTQGEFVAIVDSDDWLAPTALAETAQVLCQEPDTPQHSNLTPAALATD
jgi:cellulose synthase/poly-beta-1,6-N-acetylglucosamine synthase-like glycosyltransferase